MAVWRPANQEQVDAVLRGGLFPDEAMDPEKLEAAQRAHQMGQPKKDPQPNTQNPSGRGGFTRPGGFATGNPMYNVNAVAGMAGMMGAQQGNALQNMISQTTDAWRDEHDSRVSQNREMRRMEHEKEIERMRIEAMLQRLQAEQPRGFVDGPGSIARGPGIVNPDGALRQYAGYNEIRLG
jgi:hypothetical protein